MEESMNRIVRFSYEVFYFVKATSNAPVCPAPNGLATIYHQSEKAVQVSEKDREELDRRPFANAETAFEVLVNRLRMLYMGAEPNISGIPEPSEEMKRLDALKAICEPIENQ